MSHILNLINKKPLLNQNVISFNLDTLHFTAIYSNNLKLALNPIKPEFTIVIFIHNKPRIAVAILDL